MSHEKLTCVNFFSPTVKNSVLNEPKTNAFNMMKLSQQLPTLSVKNAERHRDFFEMKSTASHFISQLQQKKENRVSYKKITKQVATKKLKSENFLLTSTDFNLNQPKPKLNDS
jgi:hypothetical protein